jgi:hypothetical protein
MAKMKKISKTQTVVLFMFAIGFSFYSGYGSGQRSMVAHDSSILAEKTLHDSK